MLFPNPVIAGLSFHGFWILSSPMGYPVSPYKQDLYGMLVCATDIDVLVFTAWWLFLCAVFSFYNK
jgi:hypothetical protein